MTEKRILPKNRKTFVFIDVSNIRYACRWSCDFDLDFDGFYNYLNRKYPKLREVRYYEGIASGDKRKKLYFKHLRKVGYRVCSLERKSYTNEAKYANFECLKCGALNTVQVLPENTKLESNVDVFMAVDMLKCAAKATEQLHIILVSCDGDFAEAIQGVVDINPNVFVTVVATPMTVANNCLSVRLKNLRKVLPDNMTIANIENLKAQIAHSPLEIKA